MPTPCQSDTVPYSTVVDLTRETPALGRREARRIDRREAILVVAHASFLEHGYAATSMSAIAATVGGSKATLWSYFPSKEALFAAVLDQATSLYRAQLSSLLDGPGDVEATLRRFCGSFLDRVTSPVAIALHRLVHSEAGRFPEMGQIFYERAPNTTYTMVGNFIAAAMERKQLRAADPMRAAKMLTSLCQSGTHQQLLLGRIAAPTPALLSADAEAAIDVFLRAYRP